MNKIVILLAVVFLASCTAKKLAKTPTEADARIGANEYPGYTLAMMMDDKKICEEKCSNCHGLKNPAKKTPQQWPKTVKRMAGKAENNPKKAISETEQESITRYLVTMSLAAGK
jgi:cytochrome c5